MMGTIPVYTIGGSTYERQCKYIRILVRYALPEVVIKSFIYGKIISSLFEKRLLQGTGDIDVQGNVLYFWICSYFFCTDVTTIIF